MKRWVRPFALEWIFLALFLCPPAFAQVLEISGKITFQSDRDGNGEAYWMNPDGTSQTRLTNNAGDDHYGNFLPDGSRLVFRTDRDGNNEIYLMRADGSNPVNISNNSAHDEGPSWSPDGSKIAFGSVRDQANGEIYVMNADGSNVTRLTNNSYTDALPRWSPDGSKIAFKSNRDGNMEIYSMNADGTSQTNLSNNSNGDYEPYWSPDGTKILFYSNRDSNDELYSMNANGTGQTRLTTETGSGEYPGGFSPDGTRIAFTTGRDGNAEVYIANADGSNQTRITNNSAADNVVDWEGGFRKIGDVGLGGSVSRTMTIKNTGGSSLSVTNITSSDGQFTVSPPSFSVGAGNTQNVTITFTPSSTGTKYSTLTISSNATNGSSIPLIVNGTARQFTDEAFYAGVNDAGEGTGAAWGDYDGDGDQDLYVANISINPNRLYRNDGNGVFTELGAAAGVNYSGAPDAVGTTWGDYDNDGDLDLFVAIYGAANLLYRNNGNGTFTDVAATAGVDDSGGNANMGAWADYDLDGYLDLYVLNDNVANRLYHNSGNGTFTEVGSTAGVNNTGNSVSVAWGDYDNDSDPDLYVSRTTGNILYENNDDGTFTDVSSSLGVNVSSGSPGGVAWQDYDNDGDLDLYAVRNSAAAKLYQNNGNGTFTEVGATAGVNVNSNASLGPAWGDYDNDGDADLYLGMHRSANLFYKNNGNGTFTEVASTEGVNDSGGLGLWPGGTTTTTAIWICMW